MFRLVSAFLARAFVLALTAVLLGVPSPAQITNVTDTTVTPIPGAGHDYIYGLGDIVNPANGSVSLRLDLGLPTARQLAVPVAIAYDSNAVGSLGVLRQSGWTVTVPVLSVTWAQTTDNLGETCLYAYGYIFSDPLESCMTCVCRTSRRQHQTHASKLRLRLKPRLL